MGPTVGGVCSKCPLLCWGYVPSIPSFLKDIKHCQRPFLRLLRWSCDFGPYIYLCAGFHLLICVSWTMLVSLKWNCLGHEVVIIFLMCCWIWFTGIYWQVLYLRSLGKFVYGYVCVCCGHMFVYMYVCAVDICKYVPECVHAYVGVYVHAWMYVRLFKCVSVRICFGYQVNVGCLEWRNFWWKL